VDLLISTTSARGLAAACRREGAPPRASSGAVSPASLVAGSLPLAAARRLEPRGPFVLLLGAESAVLSLAAIVG